jgi:hypothetical protein
MTPDDLRDQQGRLDSLLTAQRMGRFASRDARASVEPDLRPLLDAAARMGGIAREAPTPEFANRLEAQLLERAKALSAPTMIMPIAAQPSSAPRQSPRRANPGSRWRATRAMWAALAATILLTISLGAITASAHPGAPFYPLRKIVEGVGARITGDPAAASAQASMRQADEALAAFDAAASQRDEPGALAALAQLRQDDQQAAQSISQVIDDSQRQTLQQSLNSLHTREISDLRAALPELSLAARIQVTSALVAAGDSAPVITSYSLPGDQNASDHSASGSAPNRTLIIKGSGFTAGATLLIDGKPAGVIDAITATRIVAHLPAGAQDPQQIGVEEPDGTVAVSSRNGHDQGAGGSSNSSGDNNGSGDSGHNGDTSTPGADSAAGASGAGPTPESTQAEDVTATPTATRTSH